MTAEPRPDGADLHIHTSWSDGADPPAALLARARGVLALVSFCDHDTLRAYRPLPRQDAVGILAGIEISAHLAGTELHVLGYFPDGIRASLEEFVLALEEDRRRRIFAGVRRLREDGFGLRWEALERAAGGGVPCRSHVAAALATLGYGRNPHAIFARHLSGGRFPLPVTEAGEAIARIREEGGLAVWAHPTEAQVSALLPGLVRVGLDGLEVYTPRRRRGEAARLLEAAAEWGLCATGGSDDHGRSRRRRLGDFRVPLARLPEALLRTLGDPATRSCRS